MAPRLAAGCVVGVQGAEPPVGFGAKPQEPGTPFSRREKGVRGMRASF
jgi:hypothetical protein